MSPETHPLYEVAFWLLLAALWWLFHWPYRSYRLDDARYQLFVIRDRLFEAAADGASVRFEDRAYGMTRTTINGMLRNLEDYGVFRLVFIVWRYSRDEQLRAMCTQHEQAFESAVQQLTPEGQRLVGDTVFQANRVLLTYVLHTSLLMLVLYFSYKLLQRVLTLSEIAGRLYKDWVKPALDFEANFAGHDRHSLSH